ncbi:hypothetical protein ACIBL5_36605 [Streptomyces sp. NPDC050516]|uniref:hypothetical protein n=1 Tax=Streptomyces sp. NPDC050516 TaxID=3365621 RepID=UPI0037BA3C69
MEPGVEAWYAQELAVGAAPGFGNANVPGISRSWWGASAPVAPPVGTQQPQQHERTPLLAGGTRAARWTESASTPTRSIGAHGVPGYP